MSKKLILFGVPRYSINVNDFYMFFKRSDHNISAFLLHEDIINKHDWWTKGVKKQKSRKNIVDPVFKSKFKVVKWRKLDKAISFLKNTEFDYICMGNGSNPHQKKLMSLFGRDKIICSEYGWLPWSDHFYMALKGCGVKSNIPECELPDHILKDEINSLKKSFSEKGKRVPFDNFIYVPLQKDKNDFKLGFSKFKNNKQFLSFLEEVVPNRYKILVKEHPQWKNRINFKKFSRIHNITDSGYSKHSLYGDCCATVGINSTSILEALLYNKPIIAYGKDVYTNHCVLEDSVEDYHDFEIALNNNIDLEKRHKFITLLLKRQVNRNKCINNDTEYVRNHYWNISI